MNLDTFFERFELFAGAPNAVAQMRQLVLELAVRGSLSEQLRTDQEDSIWRMFIAELDQRAHKGGPDPSPPFEIPDGWRWACLDDLGKTKVKNEVADDARVSFIPMALIPAGYGLTPLWEERTWSEVKNGFTHFADGDVVMAKITPCFENAKSAVMRNLLGKVGAGTTELHVFRRCTCAVLPEFVVIYLKTEGFIRRGEKWMTGSAGQKRVPHDYFANSPFPLPPPAEQKRIVATVNELMALCDRLETQEQDKETRHATLVQAALARFAEAPTPANLKLLFHNSYDIAPADIRKSILTLAVQGTIVPQDSKETPADDWFRTVARPNSSSVGEIAEPPFALPSGWIWLRVASVFEVAGGIQKTPYRVPRNNAFPYLGVGNVYRGRLDLSTVKEFELEPGELERRRLEAGDLLIIEGNGSFNEIGRCAKWNGEIENCVHQNHVIRCRPIDTSISDFVLLFLNSPSGMAIMQGLAITSSGLYSLSVGKIRQIVVPIPPLAEQGRIVAKVRELMSFVDALETQLLTAGITATKLLEALVAELTAGA